MMLGKEHLKMQQKVPNEVAAKRESEIGERRRKRERRSIEGSAA